MKTRLPNWFLAFLLAPFAGAVTAIALAFVAEILSGWNFPSVYEAFPMAAAVGFVALMITAPFTLVVGACVVLFVSSRRRVPALPWALTIGFVIAAGFGLLWSGSSSTVSGLELPLFAGVCSLPTAWAFWWLGLRRRTFEE